MTLDDKLRSAIERIAGSGIATERDLDDLISQANSKAYPLEQRLHLVNRIAFELGKALMRAGNQADFHRVNQSNDIGRPHQTRVDSSVHHRAW